MPIPVVQILPSLKRTSMLGDSMPFNNSSSESLEEEYDFLVVFDVLFTAFYLLPMFTVNILLLVGIISEKTLPVTVRLILGNIVASSEVIIVGLTISNTSDLILTLLMDASSHDFPCRLSSVLITSGAAGRLLFMATYAVTVYVLARYAGTKLRVPKLRLWHALLAVVVIWLFATVPNMALFSPAVFRNISSDYVCDPQPPIEYSISFIIVYGVCCFVISIIVPIVTIRYIKKNCISENKDTLKRMTKFSIFQVLGNLFNIIGISPLLLIYTIFTYYLPHDELGVILVVVFYLVTNAFFSLSLLITPIIILIFFKPVRRRFKMLFCCTCSKVIAKYASRQLSGTDSTKL